MEDSKSKNGLRPCGNDLNWAEREFCKVFKRTGDRTAAIRASGSKAKNELNAAYRMMKRPKVRRYLAYLDEREEEKVIYDAAEVKSRVWNLLEESLVNARNGRPCVGKDGKAILDPKTGDLIREPNVTAMVSIAEKMGKTIGMFKDVQTFETDLETKSDSEVFALIDSLIPMPGILERIARHPDVIQKVLDEHGPDGADSGAGEGAGRAPEEEAEPVSASPEAGGVSEGRLH